MALVHGLHFNNLRGDIYGGLTAAVVALPLALAMGVSSGAGPIAGIYGAIFVGLFGALFGGTPTQVSGPTGPMTVVMAAIFTQYAAMFPDDPSRGVAVSFTVVIMGGVLQMLLGVFRAGKYIELVPHPVVSGFMSGIGVIIILLQLPPLFGHAALPGPLASAEAMPDVLASPVADALILGGISLLIVYFLPRSIGRLIPSPLVALIVGTLVYVFFMQGGEARVLGDIPSGLPDLHLPTFQLDLLPQMFVSALTLAALGSIDSLLTSLVADNITRTYHKSNRELVGQGIGNALAGLFGGLPGAGATMRTVVNVKAGGKTPISGMLHALVLLAIVLGAGGLAADIPNAVLAGILIKVGTDIIDWDYLKHIRTAPRTGIVLMLVVFGMTVFVDLIIAVAVGMAMAGMIFMQRMVDLQLASISVGREVDEGLPLNEEEAAIMEAAEGRILLFHLGGPMSFGAAKGMARKLADFTDYDVLLLDLSDVPQIDFTSTRALFDMVSDSCESGRQVVLASSHPEVIKLMENQRVIEMATTSCSNCLQPGRLEALRVAQELVRK